MPEGLAPDVFDGHLAHQQREADKAVLKLIQDAGAAKRDPPAFDLVRRLRTPEALEAALKVRFAPSPPGLSVGQPAELDVS